MYFIITSATTIITSTSDRQGAELFIAGMNAAFKAVNIPSNILLSGYEGDARVQGVESRGVEYLIKEVAS